MLFKKKLTCRIVWNSKLTVAFSRTFRMIKHILYVYLHYLQKVGKITPPTGALNDTISRPQSLTDICIYKYIQIQ